MMSESGEMDFNEVEICDDYDHPNENLEYVLENVLMRNDGSDEFKALRSSYHASLVFECSCNESKDCTMCYHSGNYEREDTNNELVLPIQPFKVVEPIYKRYSGCSCNGLEDCTICYHGGNYQRENTNNELVLPIDHVQTEKPIFECNSDCNCSLDKCTNRLAQFGPRKNLAIVDSPKYKSKGVVTTAPIPRGAYICEYAGELLTFCEAKRRSKTNDQNNNMNYILCLYEYVKLSDNKLELQNTTIVDPSKRGNIGRYLNHSCDANCEIRAVRVHCPIPKIGIFAKRSIDAGEELCFHYCGDIPEGTPKIHQHRTNRCIPCLCSSSNCTGFLPNLEF